MHSSGKIFVPYEDYYRYIIDEEWSTYKNRIYYSGSEGLVYTGLKADNTPAASEAEIVHRRVGDGTNTPGNGYTNAFNGVLLGIPKFYNNDDSVTVTTIGPCAFQNCNTIQRITIPDSIVTIGKNAFAGCTAVKFVIMEGSTPPAIQADSFGGMAGDRIFVVPDGTRDIYISQTNWSTYSALIITKTEYDSMSSGSGFTHFVFNVDSEKTFGFSINKYDSTLMTIIYGDGTSETVNTKGNGIYREHIYAAGQYTMSIIARGSWNFTKGHYLTGNSDKNPCIREVYFDSNFVACDEWDNRKPENTIQDTNLFANAINMTTLILPVTIAQLPQYLLASCMSLAKLQLPFIGKNIDPYAESGQKPYGYLGYIFGNTSASGLKKVDHTYDGTTTTSAYIPKSLVDVTVLSGNVGYGAFSNCDMIQKITLPNTSQYIYDYGFYNCKALTSLNIPNNIQSIGKFAFCGCENLDITELPSNITVIEDNTFENCYVMDFSDLPNGIVTIGENAFKECSSLSIDSLPSGLASIGAHAFEGCTNVKFNHLPTSISTIHEYTFSRCSNIELSEIPNEMTTIPDYAFNQCPKVTFAVLPENLTSIGNYAFNGDELVAFNEIPNSVVTIGDYAFNGCTLINIKKLPSLLETIGKYAFANCINLTIASIPISITRLEDGVFQNCSAITISSIASLITYIGESAFEGCTNIRISALPNTVNLGKKAFKGCSNIRIISLPIGITNIPDEVFSGCIAITIDYIPANVVTIGSNVFANCNITSLKFGDVANSTNIANIADDAFANMTYLTDITFYSSSGTFRSDVIEKMSGYNATYPWGAISLLKANIKIFAASIALEKEQLSSYFEFEKINDGETDSYRIIATHVEMLADYAGTSKIINIGSTYTDPSTGENYAISEIGDKDGVGAFEVVSEKQSYWEQLDGLQISFSDTCVITSVGSRAFYNNSYIKNIKLPNTVKEIRDSAFFGCTNLTLASLPTDLTYIGDNAFNGCEKVYFSIIPTYIQEIGEGAFNGCDLLDTLHMESCSQITNIDISSDDVSIDSVYLPANAYRFNSFKTRNGNYTLVCGFRSISSTSGYLVYDASTKNNGNDLGFKVFVMPGGKLYVGHTLVYEGIEPNVDYTIIIRGTTSDEIVMNSVILLVNDQEYNRYNFGYVHPSVTGANTVTYGTYGFNLSEEGAIISFLEYYGHHLTDNELATKYSANMYILPSATKLTSTDIRLDFDALRSADLSSYASKYENGYIDGDVTYLSDRFSSLSWSEVNALGREGYIVESAASSTAYQAQWAIKRTPESDEEIWLQCGECKKVNLRYPTGVSFTDCTGTPGVDGEVGPMWFEIIGFGTDKSSNLGSCPITILMKDLLPEKSQLYSTSHNMRNTIVADNEDGLNGTENGTTFTWTSDESGRLWLIANDTTCISSIKFVKSGKTSGYHFNSTETTDYVNFPVSTSYRGEIAYFDGSESPIEESSLLIDARIGEFTRAEASECVVMTKGCKLGIPASKGTAITITYYSSWNLSGWRDCIARTNGNGAHFNALPGDLQAITELVTKYTNIGGLHTTINETQDKLWLLSLSEGGMYNATIPYCQEGEPFHFYRPSVASNGGRTTVRKKFIINDSPNYTYWWLRTPRTYSSNYNSTDAAFACGSSGYLQYRSIYTSYGVCFGLSTKTTDRPRLYHGTNHLKSNIQLPITASSCVHPQSGITHIYSFIVKDKTVNSTYVDMRYDRTSDTGVTGGGYIITGDSNGILFNSLYLLEDSDFENGDKIGIILRQPKILDIANTTHRDILVFKNDILYKTIDNATLTVGGIGETARVYSTSRRAASIGSENAVFEIYDIFHKELSDVEIQNLHSCRYLNFTA